jgi:hypothetical protein
MKLTIKIAVAALAAAALITPSAALAGGKSHFLGSYKVEKHIDLEGETGTYTVTCPSNDIAIDGMWRIDNVDQDNDYVYDAAPTGKARHDVLLSVEPVAAYPTSVSTYTFKFVPLSGGDVQGKLFLTCLPENVTQTGGHTHQWIVDGTGATTNPWSGADLVVPAPVGPATYSNYTHSTTACSGNDIAIAPGFLWDPNNVGTDQWGKPYQRYPSSTSLSGGWNQWDWGFFTSTGGTLKLYWNCLERLTDYNVPAAPHHRHKLAITNKLTTSPVLDFLLKDQVTEVQVICGEQYKAMLAAWDFGYSAYVWDPSDYYKHLWYMGMDPRPKARAFKVLNTDPINNIATGSQFASLCFKTKTT